MFKPRDASRTDHRMALVVPNEVALLDLVAGLTEGDHRSESMGFGSIAGMPLQAGGIRS